MMLLTVSLDILVASRIGGGRLLLKENFDVMQDPLVKTVLKSVQDATCSICPGI